MKKYIAVQVNPEYQESPLLMDIDDMEGTWLDGLCFWGNPYYKPRYNKEFEELLENLDEATQDYRAIVENQDWKPFDTVEEIVKNYFTYSGNDWDAWVEVFETHYKTNFDYEYSTIAIGLSLLTGKKYDYRQISGVVQSEWNYLFFPVDEWTDKQIGEIETEYFNKGAEYVITIEPMDEDISLERVLYCDSISVYVHGWNDDMNKKELAEVNGCKPEEIIMYNYSTRVITDYIRV